MDDVDGTRRGGRRLEPDQDAVPPEPPGAATRTGPFRAEAVAAVPGGASTGPKQDVGLVQALFHRWALVSLATLLYWFSAHSLRPLVTLRLDEMGASDAMIGLIVAAYPFFSLFFALPGGRLIDRVGILRVLGVSLLGMAVIGAGYALATTPAQILVLQVVNGVVELFVWLGLQALVSHAGSGAFRARQLSLFSLAWGIGLAAGPILGAAIYDRFGFSPLGWLYAGLSLGALVGLGVPYDRADAQRHRSSAGGSTKVLRRMAARPAVLGVLLSSFVALYVNSIKMSFYPLFLERAGMPVPRIGVLLSIIGVASLLIRVPLPAILRRWEPGTVLVWGMWVSVVPIAATPWIGPFWALAVAAALIGLGYGLNPPITVELMALHTAPEERGMAMGLRVSANRLAQVIQPLVFGAFVAGTSMALAFPLSGVLLGGLTAWAGAQAGKISSSRPLAAGPSSEAPPPPASAGAPGRSPR